MSTINRVMLGFLGAFLIGVVLLGVYQVMWVLPQKRCVEHHRWWDAGQRVCATPVDLRMFTGRPNRAPAAIGPGAGAETGPR